MIVYSGSEPISFRLYVQDDDGASMICRNYSAYEYLTFIDAIESVIRIHGFDNIVIATDYRPDTIETTILINGIEG